MASTGNVFPSVGENNAGIGATAWTSPGSVTADDTVDATCNAGASSQYLVARSFDFSAIPNDAVINGITVRVEASEHSTGTESLNAQLQNDAGTLFGSSQAQTINGTTKSVYTYGGTADVWGATLTAAIVKDADFGVRLWFTTSHDVRIDYVTMAVEYQLPPTARTRTAGPQQPVARERAGFAAAFAAAALSIAPPPGTDTVGAAQYSVGTHQARIAEQQPKPWVARTPPLLIPPPAAPDIRARFTVTGPQTQENRSAYFKPAIIPTPAASDAALTRIILTVPQWTANGDPVVWDALIPSDVVPTKLVAGSPQQSAPIEPAFSKALIPEPVVGGDAIGSAHYTVGTHRPRQLDPAIFRSLIPPPAQPGTDVQFTRLVVAAPQRPPSGAARVYGYTPPSIEDRLYSRYYEADQQSIWQPQPFFARAPIDPLPVAAPSAKRVEAGLAVVQQTQPRFSRAQINALPIDTPQPRTMLAGLQIAQQEQPRLAKAYIAPLPAATLTGRTLTTYQQAAADPPAQFFGRRLIEAIPDAPIVRFVATGPQSDSRPTAQVWRAQITFASSRFVWSSPQFTSEGRGSVRSPPIAYQALGTDRPVGVFRFSDQRFVPIQYGITTRIDLSWIESTGKPIAFDAIGFDDVFFEPAVDPERFEATPGD